MLIDRELDPPDSPHLRLERLYGGRARERARGKAILLDADRHARSRNIGALRSGEVPAK